MWCVVVSRDGLDLVVELPLAKHLFLKSVCKGGPTSNI